MTHRLRENARLTPFGSPGHEVLVLDLDVTETGLDVQLPLYLHLLSADPAFAPVNAAWIALKSDGGERFFFAEAVDPAERQLVMTQRAPALLRFVLEQALAAQELPARPGKHCQWCDFRGPCCA